MARRSNSKRRGRGDRGGRRASAPAPVLRIIGGQMRGRKLLYSGDPRTRPMKDRLREAVFNLLGPAVKGTHVVDLFAGTGALAFEALSRGALSATLIERHFPTVAVIGQNAAALGVQDRARVVAADTFAWVRDCLDDELRAMPGRPWLVFCSPPYDFYIERTAEMLELIARLIERVPPRSLFTVESDLRFDPRRLPHAEAWEVRQYRPAQIAIYEKPEETSRIAAESEQLEMEDKA